MIQPLRTPAFAASLLGVTSDTTSPRAVGFSRRTKPISLEEANVTVRWRYSSGWEMKRRTSVLTGPPLRMCAFLTVQCGQEFDVPYQGAGAHVRSPVEVSLAVVKPTDLPDSTHSLSESCLPNVHHSHSAMAWHASAQTSMDSVGKRSELVQLPFRQSSKALTSYLTVSVWPDFLALSKSIAMSCRRSVGEKGLPSISFMIQPLRTPALSA
mmetsp:Transcript_3607/g.8497  ORF Transcript_3607/g.8497 Transcript_3607/m.8497 type:complete len:211 (-) Transcript_3607:366-998(-)